jgi:hypothetical protein
MERQRSACTLAYGLDQKPYCSCIPINSIDRSIPVFRHDIGCKASFDTKARESMRRRCHDRRFDRLQAAERSLYLFKTSVARR